MDCERKGKLIGGCRFEARHDKTPADLSWFTEFRGNDVSAFVEKLRKLTYVHDICIRCGRVVKREQS